MLPVKDALDAVLLGCFVFGLLLSVVLLLFGELGFAGHEFGHDAGGHELGLLPLNASTLLAFVAWFGGVAYLAREGPGWSALVSVAVGLVGGLVGALVVGWFISMLVGRQDAVLNPEDYRLPGTIARVSSSIREHGTGEVIYEQRGVRQVAAARSFDGRAIPRGAEVVVRSSADGIVLVEPAASFFGSDGAGLGLGGGPAIEAGDGGGRTSA